MNRRGVVVIGVGNAYRGDDGAGVAVARRLRERAPADIAVHDCRGESGELIDRWDGADVAVVIDASASGATPGTIRRFDAHEYPIAATTFRGSTHSFGVVEAVELARVLGRLPPRVIVFGIEGRDFTNGADLTPPVVRAVEEVAARLIEALPKLERSPDDA